MLDTRNFEIVDDEKTAYDEVIKDINGIAYLLVKEEKVQKLITAKCKQLMRLLGDDDSEVE